MVRTRSSSLRKKVRENWTEKHRNVPGRSFGRTLDAKKAIRYWLIGSQSVSSLSDGRRHRKAQALPLSGMARSEARYSRRLQEMGANGENVEERMEMTKEVQSRTLSVKVNGIEVTSE